MDEVLAHPAMTAAAEGAPHALAREAAREAIDTVRTAVAAGEALNTSKDAIAVNAAALLRRRLTRSLRRAVNATGIILHTGLGRAPLSRAAKEALAEVASGYSNVQADVGSGERMHREVHVESLLRQLTGAEAAAVVNNNAAATVLVLNTLAAGREVVVSRGELVEIGGAFRIPDIIALSGCRLVEVGCTNRTHLRDYRNAITDATAILLAVHQSNYRIVGFSSQSPLGEIADLAHGAGLKFVHDLGSGALVDLRDFGLPHEPSVQESLSAGADVVLFSGDKLLGGPQCGIVLGSAALIEAMHRNPFYRTFRVDKLTLSALEATLRLFLDPASLPETHSVISMLAASVESVAARAEALAVSIRQACGDWLSAEVAEARSEVGGGSLPGHSLPTAVVRLTSVAASPAEMANELRLGEPPIFVRVHENAVLVDVRTVLAGEEGALVSALSQMGRWPARRRR